MWLIPQDLILSLFTNPYIYLLLNGLLIHPMIPLGLFLFFVPFSYFNKDFS